MRRHLSDNRRALLGVALALLLGVVIVGWGRVEPILELGMAILGGLLLLKAASIALLIAIRGVL